MAEIKTSMFFVANENITLSHNMIRTKYQVSGSSHCSALVKASGESADKSKLHDYFDSMALPVTGKCIDPVTTLLVIIHLICLNSVKILISKK